eukprot:TRINITY_DN5511_c0_g1_i1.p1 TRINITY_DN5511_c0_g1~~TRINITY_DN5511_c0_g1_i1.p1  ORF type:complete len:659 (+),score=270.40 TRINITY_DN5511_c0_g1_i1:117-2093(+)
MATTLLEKEKIDFTTVKFVIRVSTQPNEEVFVCGSSEELGNWDPNRSIPLKLLNSRRIKDSNDRNSSEISQKRTWTASVSLPTGKEFEYKYLLKGKSSDNPQEKWVKIEDIKGNRTLKTEGYGMAVRDSKFGKDSDSNQEVMIDSGWLVDQVQLRVFVGKKSGEDSLPQGISMDGLKEEKKLKVKLVPEGKLQLSESHYFKSVGLADDTTFVITAPSKDVLSFHLDVIDCESNQVIGRSVVQHYELEGRGLLKRPILCPATMKVAGQINLYYLIIDSFSHPNNTLFASGMKQLPAYIGHRGMGMSGKKNGPIVNQTLVENTLLSFMAAAKMGAEYVEFDVQLTRDLIPVITHDEEIWVKTESSPHSLSETLKIPVNKVKYSKIRRLKPLILDDEPEQKSEQLAALKAKKRIPKLARSKSFAEFSKGIPKEEEEMIPPSESLQKAASIWESLDTFPTLEQVLRFVPKEVGFNIEIKYPEDEAREKYLDVTERNEYINAILSVIFEWADGRKILISSFDPDVCLLCAVKQTRFPVFFLTEGGTAITKDSRKNSVEAAIQFARSSRLFGIVSDSTPILENPSLVKLAHEAGLLIFTYGHLNTDIANVRKQEKEGVDSVICDNVTKVKKEGISMKNLEGALTNPFVGKFISHIRSSKSEDSK